jgi:Lrp/AsnC family leucine-responsive transcriptional regulator
MPHDILDEIDLKLLDILQSDARTRQRDIADHVRLSIPAVSDRIHKLEEHGFISSYNATLDKNKIGLEVTAFIFLASDSSQHTSFITDHAKYHNEILECHTITGEGSYLLKVCVCNIAALEKLLNEIQSWPGIKSTKTDIVLSTVKEGIRMSLDHLRPGNEL